MTSTELIDWALDNQTLSQSEFLVALQQFVSNNSNTIPFDHSDQDTITACGITNPELLAGKFKHSQANKVSECCEEYEARFSKRDLAFLVASLQVEITMYNAIILEAMIQNMLKE